MEKEFRVRDITVNKVIGYEFLNSTFFGGYYHIDLRELAENETIGDLACHTYLIKPDKLNAIVREDKVTVDVFKEKVYINDIVKYYNGIDIDLYKVVYDEQEMKYALRSLDSGGYVYPSAFEWSSIELTT